MKKIIFSILLFVASVSLFAGQTSTNESQNTQVSVSNSISGKVVDKDTKEALAGVAVMANGQKVYTDLDGNFTISNLCGSNCELSINMISYEPQTVSVNLSQNQSLAVSLKQR